MGTSLDVWGRRDAWSTEHSAKGDVSLNCRTWTLCWRTKKQWEEVSRMTVGVLRKKLTLFSLRPWSVENSKPLAALKEGAGRVCASQLGKQRLPGCKTVGPYDFQHQENIFTTRIILVELYVLQRCLPSSAILWLSEPIRFNRTRFLMF